VEIPALKSGPELGAEFDRQAGRATMPTRAGAPSVPAPPPAAPRFGELFGYSEPAFEADAAALFTRVQTCKGDELLSQGDRWQHAWVVEAGVIRLFFVRHDGREFNKNFYAEGGLVFPLTAAMRELPSLFGIKAVDHGAVWRAPADALRALLMRRHRWDAVSRTALERLVTHKLLREHALLAFDGRTRYETFCREQPALAARLPLAQLATYLGLTDVSLSRIRRGV
jgi:CRP-like cAMP-binding protein